MKVDYLIVGQGLAGTLLAHFLLGMGRRVHLIDPGSERAASRVAAGIINPITGRRFVKSWRVDELIPFAKQTYRDLEQQLGISIYHEQPLVRAIHSTEEENDWMARAGEPSYAPYMAGNAGLGTFSGMLKPARAYGEVRQSAQVDIGELVLVYREYFKKEGWLWEEAFDHQTLRLEEQEAAYKDIRAEAVVFCEGFRGKDNPYFSYLPFKGDKGDVLLVRLPGPQPDRMLKQGVFIVPLKDGRCWVGSTYIHRFNDDQPDPKGRAEILRRLEEVLQAPCAPESHLAAVRPTVQDRRPLLGRHPAHSQLAIFNGLGTKGTSLGPFFARQMATFLVKNGKLDHAVDIARFQPFATAGKFSL